MELGLLDEMIETVQRRSDSMEVGHRRRSCACRILDCRLTPSPGPNTAGQTDQLPPGSPTDQAGSRGAADQAEGRPIHSGREGTGPGRQREPARSRPPGPGDWEDFPEREEGNGREADPMVGRHRAP